MRGEVRKARGEEMGRERVYRGMDKRNSQIKGFYRDKIREKIMRGDRRWADRKRIGGDVLGKSRQKEGIYADTRQWDRKKKKRADILNR